MTSVTPIRRERIISWFGPYKPLEARAVLDSLAYGKESELLDAILFEAMTEGWTSLEIGYAVASLLEMIGERHATGSAT
jgi:hypothetical protein